MLSALDAALAAQDPDAVQDAIFDLSHPLRGKEFIDDEVAFAVLAVLRRPEMWPSLLSGHVLNFFEFGASRLSQRAKDRCAAFLREWGNEFNEIHSMQVVGELRVGPYLLPAPPMSPKRKPRHKRT
jgi:hypothetical protein